MEVQSQAYTKHIKLKIDYFKGDKFPLSLKENYSYSFSPNLMIVPHKDSLEIRAISEGEGYVLFKSQKDTLLYITVFADKNLSVDTALQLIQSGNPFLYKNNKLACWMYSYAMLNKPIPSFQISTISGSKIDNAFLEKKPAVLHFWYYGCPACMMEIPELDKLGKWVDKRLDRYRFVSMCKDSGYTRKGKPHFYTKYFSLSKGNENAIEEFKPVNWNAIHCINASSLESVFHFEGYPTTYIVDKNGIIRFIFNGYQPDFFEEVRRRLELLDHLE